MQTLCPLTGWKTETVSRGKFVGNESRSRLVLAADNWNWIIGRQRGEDANVVGEKFFPSIRLVLWYLESIGVDAASAIADALSKITGKEFPNHSRQSAEEYGRELDNAFGTSYGREVTYPPKVFQRIFGKEDE